jgi:hypothetical protein
MHIAGAVQNPIQIVIGTDGGTISGSVLASVSGTMPNAVVAPRARRIRFAKPFGFVSLGHHRRARQLPVGLVARKLQSLFAWEWAEPDARQNPEFIRPIENTGKSITMTASDKQDNVQLNAIMLTRTAQ